MGHPNAYAISPIESAKALEVGRFEQPIFCLSVHLISKDCMKTGTHFIRISELEAFEETDHLLLDLLKKKKENKFLDENTLKCHSTKK